MNDFRPNYVLIAIKKTSLRPSNQVKQLSCLITQNVVLQTD